MADNIRLLLTERGAARVIKRERRKFYVYVIYGGTLGPMYVGKGTGYRFRAHQREAGAFLDANPNMPYEEWLAGDIRLRSKVERMAAHLTYADFKYDLVMFTDDEEEAYAKERELIARFGLADDDRGSLSNLSNGWRVTTASQTRKKISKALTGKIVDSRVGEKISAALKGRRISDRVRQRMADGQRGRKLTKSVRSQISASRLASDRIKRVAVEIHGIRYASMVEAAEKSGYNYGTINYRLRIGSQGFERLSN